jgi:site-specific recombinase XerD
MADTATPTTAPHTPWNKGKLIGQKSPLKVREVWIVRTRLQMAGTIREMALFNLAIDSKLRGCDLVRLMVRDLAQGSQVLARATVVQQKTKQPVRFEVTDQTRDALTAWIVKAKLAVGDYLFPSRQRGSPHLSTRQYARIVKGWIALLGGDPQAYGTHSLHRTKASYPPIAGGAGRQSWLLNLQALCPAARPPGPTPLSSSRPSCASSARGGSLRSARLCPALPRSACRQKRAQGS